MALKRYNGTAWVVITAADIGAVALTSTQTITGQKTFSNGAIPVYFERNTTSVGSIYAGAVFERKGANGTDGSGIGAYFRTLNSSGTATWAGVFGGRLAVASGTTVGEIVFSPAYNNADPYTRADLRVRATGANTADAYLTGNMYVNGNKKSATEEWVNDQAFLKSFTETDPTVPSWAKASSLAVDSLPTVTVAKGGTNATTATDARTNLGLSYGTASGTVCQGNDSRLSNARTPTELVANGAIGGIMFKTNTTGLTAANAAYTILKVSEATYNALSTAIKNALMLGLIT